MEELEMEKENEVEKMKQIEVEEVPPARSTG